MGVMISIKSYLVFVLNFKSPALSVFVMWTKHILGGHFESEDSTTWYQQLSKYFLRDQGAFVPSFKDVAPLVSEI